MSGTWRLVALMLPLALASCFVAPGRFTSTLDIRADRSFSFTYVGEVIAPDEKGLGESLSADDGGEGPGWEEDGEEDNPQPIMLKIAAQATSPKERKAQESLADSSDDVARLEALAKTLSQEYGFRSARYIGDHKLAVDYAVSGRLDHSFIFPFNVDAEIIVPFLAIELRGKDRLRVKAPAFANARLSAGGMTSLPGADKAPGDALDGIFTLTTSAEIVSQNQEDGATLLADGRHQIVWRATPALRDAPMAVLKVAPLP